MNDQQRTEGFFDGLMGREPATDTDGAYADGYQAGRAVWRRPRRKRPQPDPSNGRT